MRLDAVASIADFASLVKARQPAVAVVVVVGFQFQPIEISRDNDWFNIGLMTYIWQRFHLKIEYIK